MADRQTSAPRRFTTLMMGAVMLAMMLAGGGSAPAQTDDASRAPIPPVSAVQILELSHYLAATSGAPDAYARIVNAAFGGGQGVAIKVTAYEENRSFVYAVGQMGSQGGEVSTGSGANHISWVRRTIVLNPSTFIVDDQLLGPVTLAMKIGGVLSQTAPQVSGHTAQITEPNGEISAELLFPRNAAYRTERAEDYLLEAAPSETGGEVRQVQILSVGKGAPSTSAVHFELASAQGTAKLVATLGGKVYRLTLPPPAEGAGEVAIATEDGETLLADRPFPEGILPHGPEGNRLLELWDSDYRHADPALWDIGRPADELQKVVESGKVPRCRVVDMCCGSGSDAIYLASKGYDVTAIDVAPTALGMALEKARKANVSSELDRG